MNGAYTLAGLIGILLYSGLGGWMFDQIGPKSPFVLIGVFDLMFAIGCVVWARKNKQEVLYN
jgi:predicted MFS family arabinose efflux permease